MSEFKIYEFIAKTKLVSPWAVNAQELHQVVFDALKEYTKNNNIVIGIQESSVDDLKDEEVLK